MDEAMTFDLMSSEESNKEDVIVVRPLHWKSKGTEKMIKALDDVIQKNMSDQ